MSKKLIVVLVSLLFLAFAGFFALPMLINKNAVRNQVVASFKTLTGLDLVIQGRIDLEAFPLPHMIIHDLYVPNIPTASTPFLLTVKSIDIRPVFLSLFKATPDIGSLNVTGVNVELERLKDGGMSWQETPLQAQAQPGSSAQKAASPAFNLSAVNVANAALRYTDSVTDESFEYKNIKLHVTNAEKDGNEVKLSFEYKDRPFAVEGQIGNLGKAIAAGAVPARLTLASGKSRFVYDGKVGYRGKHYQVDGKASFDTDDAFPWIMILSRNADISSGSGAKPLPLKLNTDIVTQGDKILLNNIALDGTAVKGAARLEYAPPYRVSLEAAVASLDLETLIGSALFSGSRKAPAPAPDAQEHGAQAVNTSEKTLWNQLALNADIKVADAVYNGQHIQNAHFNFDMDSGEINIPQASAMLPGQSRLVFTGIGREGYQGITLEGQIDAAGGNFVDMIKIFKSKGFTVPPEDFRRFRIKTNAVISTKEARFSELVVRIENMGFVGGVVAIFGDRMKLQTALRIGGLNLDHFITLWGFKAWENSFLADTPGQRGDEFISHWLKQLSFDLQLNASIEQYVLDGKLSQKTDFEVAATPGKIKVEKLNTFHNGSTLNGSIALDITGAMPRVDMDMTADVFDTNLFFGEEGGNAIHSMARRAQAGEFWSHKGFDFHWFDLFNSDYHIRIGRFTDGAFEGNNIDMKGNLSSRTLTMDSFSGESLGARFEGKAILAGGKIPALNIAVNVQDLDALHLPQFLPVLEGIKGKYNLNMHLETSGIDMFTWVSNLNGTLGIAGRNIVVHGFNLPGIVKAVSYVRTVANILNVVKRAFPGGDTVFSRVSGRWTITNGVATSSDTTLVNPDSDGNLNCKVDLVNWRIDGRVSFPLQSLDATNPPSMILMLTGNLDGPEKNLDTRQLEQYVTNQTSEKMLRDYSH